MKFRVGERAIYIPTNEEVTIVEPLRSCTDPDGHSWFGYPTDKMVPARTKRRFGELVQLSPRPSDLRKKTDQEDPAISKSVQLSSWDKVGWNPHKTVIMERA